MTVGGKARGAFVDDTALADGKGMLSHLRDPSAVKGTHLVLTIKIHETAHHLRDGHRGLPHVFQHSAAAQYIVEESEVQLQRKPCLGHGDAQGLCLSLRLRQGTFHGHNARKDLMALIAEVRGDAAQLQRAFPIVTPSRTAPCERHGIGAALCIPFLQQHSFAPANSLPQGKGFRILCTHLLTKVQQFQQSIGVHPQQAGDLLTVESEHAVLIFDHCPVPPAFFSFSPIILYLPHKTVNDIR